MSSHEAQQLELPFPETDGALYMFTEVELARIRQVFYTLKAEEIREAQRQEQQAEFARQLESYFARFEPRRIR